MNIKKIFNALGDMHIVSARLKTRGEDGLASRIERLADKMLNEVVDEDEASDDRKNRVASMFEEGVTPEFVDAEDSYSGDDYLEEYPIDDEEYIDEESPVEDLSLDEYPVEDEGFIDEELPVEDEYYEDEDLNLSDEYATEDTFSEDEYLGDNYSEDEYPIEDENLDYNDNEDFDLESIDLQASRVFDVSGRRIRSSADLRTAEVDFTQSEFITAAGKKPSRSEVARSFRKMKQKKGKKKTYVCCEKPRLKTTLSGGKKIWYSNCKYKAKSSTGKPMLASVFRVVGKDPRKKPRFIMMHNKKMKYC